ncbi:predicted protein [Histoplasma capsulatum var. duboisii H88]|uniref:Predicted protein n=2 Tax=Ajellomyces capsulatus TaxID=5037 RepID=F0ULS6_AJEC8|nr:predicted protein [Histoplasma capsulatum H143]EGC48024.1 predicted protein [Histoplasma capsulatum var. duboisii H88]
MDLNTTINGVLDPGRPGYQKPGRMEEFRAASDGSKHLCRRGCFISMLFVFAPMEKVENFAGKSGDWDARSKVQTILRITVVEGVDTVVAMLPGSFHKCAKARHSYYGLR